MEIDHLVPSQLEPAYTGKSAAQVVVQALFRTHGPDFRKRALKLTRNASDAHDLLQDTVERTIRYMPEELTPGAAKCWFYVTMRNLFLDRQKAYETRCRTDLSEDELANVLTIDVDTDQTPNSKLYQELYRAIERLESSLRDVVHLRLFDELSLAEIAQRLNVQPATIGSRLFRAKKKLYQLLLADSIRA